MERGGVEGIGRRDTARQLGSSYRHEGVCYSMYAQSYGLTAYASTRVVICCVGAL